MPAILGHSRALLVCCALLSAARPCLAQSAGSFPNGSGWPATPAREDLLRLNQQELLAIFRQGRAARLPDGFLSGRLLWCPGSPLTTLMAHFFQLVWRGKYISNNEGTVGNRMCCIHRVDGKLKWGTSMQDGQPAVILDYSETGGSFSDVRDEIREVGPGLFLGLMYRCDQRVPRLARIFILEAAP